MKNLKSAAISLLLVFTASMSAHAAGKDEADNSEICIESPRWHPTLDDNYHIEDAPVPTSIRSQSEAIDACVRWNFDSGSFISWHLRSGSARSVTSAIAYLEKDEIKALSDPSKFVPTLRRALKAALPDLQHAASLKQPEGLNYNVSYRYIEQSPKVKKFQNLLAVREGMLALAQKYLLAAEEFKDKGLLEKADLYLKTAYDGAVYLAPLETQPPIHYQLFFNLYMYQYEDLRARAVILRAEITQSHDDILAARTLILLEDKPIYSTAVGLSIGNSSPICTVDLDYTDADKVKAACEDDDFKIKAQNYVVNRAALDLIDPEQRAKDDAMVNDWGDSFDIAMKILLAARLEKATHTMGNISYASQIDEATYRLLVTRSIVSARQFGNISKLNAAEGHSDLDWYRALSNARDLVQTITPYDESGRFKRAARRWLELWHERSDLGQRYYSQDGSHNEFGSAGDYQFAAYLETTLSNLNTIQRGTKE